MAGWGGAARAACAQFWQHCWLPPTDLQVYPNVHCPLTHNPTGAFPLGQVAVLVVVEPARQQMLLVHVPPNALQVNALPQMPITLVAPPQVVAASVPTRETTHGGRIDLPLVGAPPRTDLCIMYLYIVYNTEVRAPRHNPLNPG